MPKKDLTFLYLLVGAIVLSNIVSSYGMYQNQQAITALGDALQNINIQTVAVPTEAEQPTVEVDNKEVNLFILNDKDCPICDTQGIISSLQQLMPNLKTQTIDYSTVQGKQIIQELGLTSLPAFYFDSSITNSSAYDNIGKYIDQNNDKYLLRTAGNLLVGREETSSAQIDLFVMSKCPYGTQAEANMEDVLKKFNNLSFNLYFIANDNGDGTFESLHGQPEIDENMRQLCVIKNYPETWFDYILCRNDNISSDEWEPCATQSGMDSISIETCMNTEASDLLGKNIKLANDLQIGSSPTFLINNKYLLSGVQSAEDIISMLCEVTTGLSGC